MASGTNSSAMMFLLPVSEPSKITQRGNRHCCWWTNMSGTVDMDVAQDGSVIGRTFLLTIPPVCSSRSGMQLHSLGIITGVGMMVWGWSPDIRGFIWWILMQRRLQGIPAGGRPDSPFPTKQFSWRERVGVLLLMSQYGWYSGYGSRTRRFGYWTHLSTGGLGEW